MIKEKRNNYKFWHSPLALVILFFLLIFFSYKIVDLIRIEQKTANEKEMELDKIDKKESQKQFLLQETSKLKTKEGIESVIREKYQVVRPEEKMVTIVDEEAKTNSMSKEEKVSHGFWNWIKSIFNR